MNEASCRCLGGRSPSRLLTEAARPLHTLVHGQAGSADCACPTEDMRRALPQRQGWMTEMGRQRHNVAARHA